MQDRPTISEKVITTLLSAARMNDINELITILDNVQFDEVRKAHLLQEQDDTGCSPLHWAVTHDNQEMVRLLLNHGTYIDLINMDSKTAFDLALDTRNWEMIDTLVDNAKPISTPRYYGRALLVAAQQNHLKTAYRLLVAGATQTWVTQDSENYPLHCAVLNDSSDMVQLLLAWKSTVSVKNRDKKTALDLAVDGKNWAMVETIVNAQSVSTPDLYGRALILAGEQNQWQTVQCLLAAGANQTWCTIDSHNYLLHCAVISNEPDMVRLLLAHEDTVGAKNKKHKTPLDLAIDSTNFDMIETLVNAQLTKTPALYGRALLVAADHNKLKTVKCLLAAGAKQTWFITDSENYPLHCAVVNNNSEMVQLLLTYENTTTKKNKDNKTAIDLAMENENWELALLIIYTMVGELSFQVVLGFNADIAAYVAECVFNIYEKQLNPLIDDEKEDACEPTSAIDETSKLSYSFDEDDILVIVNHALANSNCNLEENKKLSFLIADFLFRQPVAFFANAEEKYLLCILFYTLSDNYLNAKLHKAYCYLYLAGQTGVYTHEEMLKPLGEKYPSTELDPALLKDRLIPRLKRYSQNNRAVNNELGDIYECLKDYASSFFHSTQSANMGCRDSITRLVRFHESAILAPNNYKLLYYVALHNHFLGNKSLALQQLLDVMKNEKGSGLAFDYLQNELANPAKKVTGNDIAAQQALAEIYLRKKDYERVAYWAFNVRKGCVPYSREGMEYLSDPRIRRYVNEESLLCFINNHMQQLDLPLLNKIFSHGIREEKNLFCSALTNPLLLSTLSFETLAGIFKLQMVRAALTEQEKAKFLIYCLQNYPDKVHLLCNQFMNEVLNSLTIKGLWNLKQTLKATWAISVLLAENPASKAILQATNFLLEMPSRDRSLVLKEYYRGKTDSLLETSNKLDILELYLHICAKSPCEFDTIKSKTQANYLLKLLKQHPNLTENEYDKYRVAIQQRAFSLLKNKLDNGIYTVEDQIKKLYKAKNQPLFSNNSAHFFFSRRSLKTNISQKIDDLIKQKELEMPPQSMNYPSKY